MTLLRWMQPVWLWLRVQQRGAATALQNNIRVVACMNMLLGHPCMQRLQLYLQLLRWGLAQPQWWPVRDLRGDFVGIAHR